jgi:hypothetical protein
MPDASRPGAAVIAAAPLTPFPWPGRRTWGLDVEPATRASARDARSGASGSPAPA